MVTKTAGMNLSLESSLLTLSPVFHPYCVGSPLSVNRSRQEDRNYWVSPRDGRAHRKVWKQGALIGGCVA